MNPVIAGHSRSYFIMWATLTVIVASLIAAGGGLYLRATDSRAAQTDNRQTWHRVVCFIEVRELSAPGITLDQKKSLVKFWNDTLDIIGVEHCP